MCGMREDTRCGPGIPVRFGGVTISPLPDPSPTSSVVVRVVVVNAGSGASWVTLAIAIAGLVLSLASIGWQAFAFRRSGHHIHVSLKVGILSGSVLGELIYKGHPSLEVMDEALKRGFTLVVIAIIRNDGRQAVTIEMCEWRTHTTGTAGTTAGDPLPRQLEPGASCRVAFDLAAVLILLSLSDSALKQRKRKVSAIIHLGSGGRVRSKPLRIPIGAMRYLFSGSGASNRTPSGVGWPDSAATDL